MLHLRESSISSAKCFRKKRVRPKGRGVLNTLINKLPFELHIPGYKYCGPGTKLGKRLARGDKGVNLLDEACKEHDIAYSQFKDTETRNKADRILAEKAFDRVKASDSSVGEKIAALTVSGVMKAKSKMGMGIRRKRKSKSGKGMIRLKPIRVGKKGSKRKFRLIPTPKRGGFLPLLLPILGALGALAGGASGIAKTVIDAKNAKKAQLEVERHNKELESIAKQQKGSGLYLKPYKTGSGFYSKKKVR